MVNFAHLKVLLKKDLLTLWRSKHFLLGFLILPILLMSVFSYIKNLVDYGQKNGSMIDEYFRYTSTLMYPESLQFYDYPAYDESKQRLYISSLKYGCQFMNKYKYFYSKIAVVSSNQSLGLEFRKYLQNYVLSAQDLIQNQTGKFFKIDYFQDQNDLNDIVRNQKDQPYCFSVNIKEFNVFQDKYEISFSFDMNSLPNTMLPSFIPSIMQPDTKSWNQWLDSGVIALYPYLTEFIARYKISTQAGNFNWLIFQFPLFGQQMGYTPMKTDTFTDISSTGIQLLSKNFPFFIMIIFMIPFFYLTQKMANEKESKAKEGMKMMGLTDSTYYISWFITYLIISFETCIIVTFMFCFQIFHNINFILFFTICILYSLTFFGLSFIIVAFLPKKRSSSIAAVLINFITFFLSQMISDPAVSKVYQYLLSIFPNVCINQIVKQIFYLAFQTKDGLTFNSWNIVYQGYSFKIGFYFLLGEACVLILLGIYLDQIVPSQYGVSKKWNFLCYRRKKILLNQSFNDLEKQNSNFESVPDFIKKQEENQECFIIQNLQKKFGKKKAIKNLNLTIYNSQIFALLGHNGAGKTTTLSILTGLLEPSSGSAHAFGINIHQNMNEFRKKLGVCPQHDILFDLLTVEEHLKLFASFKGCDTLQIDNIVKQMILDIDLEKQKFQITKTLSGGQKRKLSVAIAMIGDSKIVMLDEPSSGMDTTSRRRMWDMLKKNKNGKIIIFSTHYMDEADILADRIGIMADGSLQCVGSSLFLKNRFGVGYNLKIEKFFPQSSPQIEEYINRNLLNAQKIMEVSTEITFKIPKNSSNQFKQFFNDFDKNLKNLGIRSYAVGITTLEEVFLNIGTAKENQQIELQQQITCNQRIKAINYSRRFSNNLVELNNYSISNHKISKCIFFQQLFIQMKKKFLVQYRDKKSLGIDILFPIILIIIGLQLASVSFIQEQQNKLMDLNLIPQNTFFYNDQSNFIKDSSEIRDFIIDYVINEQQNNLQIGNQVHISKKQNITQQITQLDDFIYNQSKQLGKAFYAQLYLQEINSNYYNGLSAIQVLNSTSQDIVGIYAGVVHIAFLKKFLDDFLIDYNPKMKVNFINEPFPLTKQSQFLDQAASGTTSALLIAIAWLMISDSFIQNVIKERQLNIKQMTILSGSSLKAYWLSHYLCDIIFQSIPSIIAIIGIIVFGIKIDGIQYLFIAMIFANPAFIYCFSFFFEKEETGSLLLKIIYFVVGIIVPVSLSIFQVFDKSTYSLAEYIRWFFFPFPIFSLTFGYISICNVDIIQVQSGIVNPLNSFDYQVAGPNLKFLIASTLIYWIIIFLFEFRILKACMIRISRQNNKYIQNYPSFLSESENDIFQEEKKVENLSSKDIPARVLRIQKQYGKINAIKDISFCVEKGECFALLGVSGAGKTTCFKCLTGEIAQSSGSIEIFGNNIISQYKKAVKMIGYCPQFDAIINGLTVREHLQFYATLKGVKSDIKDQLIYKQIAEMDLIEFENAKACNLSGGNKRKLSVSIAMIGNPPLILLDEPSTGVDPSAKRFMWDIISKTCQKNKNSVILTTHSMEEAEALCTKMGIMVSGEFKCFGSSIHIKDKFGTGYEIEFKIRQLTEKEVLNLLKQKNNVITYQNCISYLQDNNSEDLIDELCEDGFGKDLYMKWKQNIEIDEEDFIKWYFLYQNGFKAIEFIENKFVELQIIEHYGNSWKLKVSRDNYSIGYLFGLMEDIVHQYNISEYSVAQTSLEQIFNNFASDQKKSFKKKSSQFSQIYNQISKQQ